MPLEIHGTLDDEARYPGEQGAAPEVIERGTWESYSPTPILHKLFSWLPRPCISLQARSLPSKLRLILDIRTTLAPGAVLVCPLLAGKVKL